VTTGCKTAPKSPLTWTGVEAARRIRPFPHPKVIKIAPIYEFTSEVWEAKFGGMDVLEPKALIFRSSVVALAWPIPPWEALRLPWPFHEPCRRVTTSATVLASSPCMVVQFGWQDAILVFSDLMLISG
jgi:hypothetical protein